MSQITTHSCTNCGAALPENMRFCPNCGVPVPAGVGALANYNSGGGSSLQAPPPPPDTYPPTQRAAPYPAYPQQAQQGYQPPLQGAQPPPVYAKPQKNASRGVLGKVGIGVGVIILLVLLLLGTGGYFLFKFVGSSISNRLNSGTTNGTSSTPSPVKTTPIGSTVTYASVDITIINVQQADRFVDDNSADHGLLRLNLKEQTTVQGVIYTYSACCRLLLPDGKSVVLSSDQHDVSLNEGTSQTNWIDFPMPVSTNVSQLIFQLGSSTEAQINVPLKSGADLSQYQTKTVSPNAQAKYAGLIWTVTSATSKLSDDGTQAAKGMLYVAVTLKADNPTSSGFLGIPDSYIRLQSGGTTSSPTVSTTFPTAVNAGQVNVTGIVTFSMPQGSTDFTLIFLADPSGTPAQATIAFSIK